MTANPNVLVIGTEIGTSTMASGFRTGHVIAALRRRGCRVTIINLTGKQPPADDSPDIIHMRTHDGRAGRLSRFLSRLLRPDYPHSGKGEACVRLLARDGAVPDVIYCGTPPHSAHRVAREIASALGIPYMADLRDDWAGNHRRRYLTPLHRMHSRMMEAAMVSDASCVILNTPVVRARFDAAYPGSTHKFLTVTNGYDRTLDAWRDRPCARRELVISYSGSPYWGFMESRIRELHAGLARLSLPCGFRIQTMGDAWGIEPLSEPLPGWTHHGQLDEASMAARLADSHLLLLAMPPGEGEPSPTVPLKTYGYLRLGKSIVYLGERGATTDLLSRFAGTWSLGRESWPALPEWISTNQDRLRSVWSRPDSDQFEIQRLADGISERLVTLAQGGRSR